MRTLTVLLLLLIAVPVVEISAFIAVAYLIGIGWALLLLLGTCAVGGILLTRVSSRAWRGVRDALAQGQAPGRGTTGGLLLFLAALLILLPGFVTDLIGALLLIPPVRALAGTVALRIIENRLSPEVAGHVFGPRRVRVRRTTPTGPDSPDQTEPDSPPLEGEIIDPGPPR